MSNPTNNRLASSISLFIEDSVHIHPFKRKGQNDTIYKSFFYCKGDASVYSEMSECSYVMLCYVMI